jgi:ATP-dependent Lon protease
VGKTSIGHSIATALGRNFTKISLGGVRDEAEIRGHRRTYVGAMPGRIIKAISNAKSMNPVFMLDEIDKLGNDFRGDPSSALLEVLDPEQNHAFEDHYLDLPFDLSEVLFIATANSLDTIPPALLDRLEIIQYSGYTAEEKFQIAKRYLLAKAVNTNALKTNQLQIADEIIQKIIKNYVKEAGVRDLERQINKIMRKIAREILEGKKDQVIVDDKKLKKYLGPVIFDETLAEKDSQIGLATGLAWTSVGGDVLFVEVALSPGKGQIKLTGKLGEVMKESAQAALTYVSSHHKELGIKIETINKSNVHIHVPEGAVPKDGPSAGVTITTALVSAFTRKPVRREVAMTGEVTLRGRVLRIGGLKEKAIAAYNAGSKIVIIPQENERDLEKIKPLVKNGLVFKPVSDVAEVLKIALQD